LPSARDGSIWRHDLKALTSAKRLVELNPPGTEIASGQGVPPAVGAGVWESSGIIDASAFFGKDSWLFVVQAHGPSLAPVPNTVEDGRLILKRAAKPAASGDDEDGSDSNED
jgi:hypothetical protein